MYKERANVKVVDINTTFKTKEEMFRMLANVDLLFIEGKAKQAKEIADVAKNMGVMAIGVVTLPDSDSKEMDKIRIH